MKQKSFVKVSVSALAIFLFAAQGNVSLAATNTVVFDQGAGKLTVSGTCSANFVLVVIRRSSDGTIWGSSNPPCDNGSYEYSVTVTEGDRQGGTFIVDAVDSASAAEAPPAKNSGSGAGAGGQAVTFSAPAPAAAADASITLDTSSVATAPDDQSLLDSVLSKFFGIVADATDAVQSFGAIFANSVKASLVAAVDLFSKNITIIPDGSITVPRGANQMAGTDWLSAGATDVFIPNTLVASSSEVIVTPTSVTDVPLAVIEKSDGDGFRVGISHPAAAAISFDWLIVQTYSAAPPSVAEQSISLGGSSGGGSVQPADDSPPAPPADAVSPDSATSSIDVPPPDSSDVPSSTDVSGSASGTESDDSLIPAPSADGGGDSTDITSSTDSGDAAATTTITTPDASDTTTVSP